MSEACSKDVTHFHQNVLPENHERGRELTTGPGNFRTILNVNQSLVNKIIYIIITEQVIPSIKSTEAGSQKSEQMVPSACLLGVILVLKKPFWARCSEPGKCLLTDTPAPPGRAVLDPRSRLSAHQWSCDIQRATQKSAPPGLLTKGWKFHWRWGSKKSSRPRAVGMWMAIETLGWVFQFLIYYPFFFTHCVCSFCHPQQLTGQQLILYGHTESNSHQLQFLPI